jgi:hypothetical protein
MSEFFKSELDKQLFSLLSLDGASRAKHLGITQEMYHKSELADAWYQEQLGLLQTGHNDSECNPIHLIKAREKLDEIYNRMVW